MFEMWKYHNTIKSDWQDKAALGAPLAIGVCGGLCTAKGLADDFLKQGVPLQLCTNFD